LGAARTIQAGAGTSGFGTALQGLANNPQLMSGIQNYFNPPYVQNQNAFNYGQTSGFSDGSPVTLF
jgi:hypothetical protein